MADQITDAAFDESVLKSDLPVLVDFWAPWCGPCRAVGPIVDEISKDYADRLRVFKMNVDENSITPAKYGIRAIPTLIIFKNGQVAAQHTGSMPKEEICKILETVL
ncbi:MAG: thioredoxin [Candidatus Desulfovibrio faecigallinarum]|uniref:thioredoxin n=1 Tax=Desulfovibrio sp. An276 TaxID=1965618 RepID=UPI000B3AAEBA|nr:thioredoxin [Desulfovibrio sp. An276]MBU3831425.1 thioredoxin [Candidatus Desulfovibrio faecigallinarum]OUO53604.1 thioredoxin [Desulfovibrio sp. An276]